MPFDGVPRDQLNNDDGLDAERADRWRPAGRHRRPRPTFVIASVVSSVVAVGVAATGAGWYLFGPAPLDASGQGTGTSTQAGATEAALRTALGSAARVPLLPTSTPLVPRVALSGTGGSTAGPDKAASPASTSGSDTLLAAGAPAVPATTQPPSVAVPGDTTSDAPPQASQPVTESPGTTGPDTAPPAPPHTALPTPTVTQTPPPTASPTGTPSHTPRPTKTPRPPHTPPPTTPPGTPPPTTPPPTTPPTTPPGTPSPTPTTPSPTPTIPGPGEPGPLPTWLPTVLPGTPVPTVRTPDVP